MSLLKFFAQPANGKRDEDSLWWGRVMGGQDEVPFRGRAAPMLTEDEQQQKVQTFCDAHTKVLDLSKPEDLAQYTDVLDHWANGWWRLVVHEKVYDQELKNWRIFLAWVEPYKGLVHSKPMPGTTHGADQTGGSDAALGPDPAGPGHPPQ